MHRLTDIPRSYVADAQSSHQILMAACACRSFVWVAYFTNMLSCCFCICPIHSCFSTSSFSFTVSQRLCHLIVRVDADSCNIHKYKSKLMQEGAR